MFCSIPNLLYFSSIELMVGLDAQCELLGVADPPRQDLSLRLGSLF